MIILWGHLSWDLNRNQGVHRLGVQASKDSNQRSQRGKHFHGNITVLTSITFINTYHLNMEGYSLHAPSEEFWESLLLCFLIVIGFHFIQVTFWTSGALQLRCFPFLTIHQCRMQVLAAGSLDCWCLEDFSLWIWKKKYGFELLMDSRCSFLLHVEGKWFLSAPFLVQCYSSTSPLNKMSFCSFLSCLFY